MGCSILVLASGVSTLGGLVFGYELGIISGALLQLKTEFNFSCIQQEAVVSAFLVGALLASLIGGCLIDRHGQRNSILISNVLILAGSLLLVCSSFLALVVGRITVGFAMCISSMSCCIFVSEMVTPNRRGLLVTLYEAGITVGILAAYAINYILSDIREGWKYMFGLAIVPTLVQFASIWFLPSNSTEPLRPQAGKYPENQEVDDGKHNPKRLNRNMQYKITYLFQQEDNMRTRTIIGLGLVIFQQFTGQPNVLFYASTIFHALGFQSNASAVLASVGLGAVKVMATLIAMMFADRVGRRPLLIGGCSVMAVCLAAIGLLSGHSVFNATRTCESVDIVVNASLPHLIPTNRSAFDLSPDGSNRHLIDEAFGGMTHPAMDQFETASTPPPMASPSLQGRAVDWLIVICMMAVVSAYAIGFGPMTWLLLSEIFPAGVRGRAFAFTNVFNWAANLLVTFSFLNVIDVIGLSGTFLLYGMTAVAAGVFFYFMLPETKGKSLEAIDRELCLKRLHHSKDCCTIIKRNVTTLKYQRVDCQLSITD
ncbi:solute carrier family 2, facilitated glucose transporter member 10 [Lampris incognitus]|uniref:solute carrier family 2, facilitated glucose transporter member 10 n=1 Tax=Lampris incognitus TaxID=2546036 RepID=UPI0024B48884|nr:solute carrier family 2, facilitated glucose transporter member 10 [Lampris incognitus]